jgi:hypothetical protein
VAEVGDLWPVEVIQGKAFSTLRYTSVDRTEKHSPVRLAIVCLVACLSVGIGANFVIGRILEGEFIWGNVFALILFPGMYLALAIGGIVLGKRQKQEPLPIRPDHVPEMSIRAIASVKNSVSGTRSTGWLWFDQGMLWFWSEAYWFRLKREDFGAQPVRSKHLVLAGQGRRLVVPKGFPDLAIKIEPVANFLGSKTDRQFASDAFERMVKAMASADSSLASVLPPARTRAKYVDPLKVTVWSIAAGLTVGATVHLALARMPSDVLAVRNPADHYLFGLFACLAFGGLYYGMSLAASGINRKIDTLTAKQTVL